MLSRHKTQAHGELFQEVLRTLPCTAENLTKTTLTLDEGGSKGLLAFTPCLGAQNIEHFKITTVAAEAVFRPDVSTADSLAMFRTKLHRKIVDVFQIYAMHDH